MVDWITGLEYTGLDYTRLIHVKILCDQAILYYTRFPESSGIGMCCIEYSNGPIFI